MSHLRAFVACVQLTTAMFVFSSPSTLTGEIPTESLKVMPPMSEIYHPVSTLNKDAQKSFNRGLTYIFAFNHDIAFTEFENAAKYDPELAMAYWGMALALGQNINEDIKPENRMRCYDYIQKALTLSSSASRSEQEYINALATRYTNNMSIDPATLRAPYRMAMKRLVQQYPEDLDAATMYAESILDLDPWKWWTPDKKPKEGTYEAIDVLEFVLMRDPDHIGANHYYIHAFEESPFPQRALMSAHRLETLLPESGHLLHMPTHTFLLVGDYDSALRTSKNAIAQDKEYFQKIGMSAGTYPMHYLPHNMLVLTRTYMLMEDYKNAIAAALDLTKFVEPFVATMPDMGVFYKVPLEIYLYFHKWPEILAYTIPNRNPTAQAYLHYARGMAYAATGDLGGAQREKVLMQEARQQIPPNVNIANNFAGNVIDFAGILLDASMADARRNYAESIDLLKRASDIQESMFYDEPPAYHVPARQLLGFALLKQKQYVEAERAFLDVLKTYQRNGRTLFGLSLALKGQGRTVDAYWIEREMTAALKNASAPLQLDNM